jgi:hypothetical protein
MGHNLPQAEVANDYFLGLFWASAIAVSILIWPVPARHRAPLIGTWIVKCAVMLGFMLILESRYDIIDSWGYFEASAQKAPLFDGLSLGDGSANIICLVRLHNYIFPYSYHGMKVTFGLFGFLGCYLFYRALVMYLGCEDQRMFYLLLLWPSILFWSSILGKDPIVYFGLGLYALGILGWLRTKRARYIMYASFGVAIAMMIRVWMGPILVGALLVFVVLTVRSLIPKVLLCALLAASFLAGAQQVIDHFAGRGERGGAFENINQLTASEYARAGGSSQVVSVDLTSPTQVIRFLPLGVFTALFRPMPGEVRNLFGTLAGLEDTALLVFMFLAVTRTSWKRLREPVMLWLAVLIVGWAVVYAPISSLNLGMGHRYRLQVMPFMLCWFLYQGRKRPKLAYVPSHPPSRLNQRGARSLPAAR